MSNGYKVDNISIEQYLDSVIEEDIREDHPAQREFCWKKDMTDGLLYSAISRKIFIPSFVLVEETQQDGSKEVYIADALQRTVSLKMFKYQGLKISNNLKTYIVTYEKKKKDENGHYVRDENGNIIKDENDNNIPIQNISFDTPNEDGVNLIEIIDSGVGVENSIHKEYFSINNNFEDFSPQMKDYIRSLSKMQIRILEYIENGYTEYEIVEKLDITLKSYRDCVIGIKSQSKIKKIVPLIRRKK